jgi:hypothetical protein
VSSPRPAIGLFAVLEFAIEKHVREVIEQFADQGELGADRPELLERFSLAVGWWV